jgi:hypothetical protein
MRNFENFSEILFSEILPKKKREATVAKLRFFSPSLSLTQRITQNRAAGSLFLSAVRLYLFCQQCFSLIIN